MSVQITPKRYEIKLSFLGDLSQEFGVSRMLDSILATTRGKFSARIIRVYRGFGRVGLVSLPYSMEHRTNEVVHKCCME